MMPGPMAGPLAGPVARLGVDAALEAIWSALPDARLVGGVVRDLLSGRPVSDIDLATPEPPETVLARLRAAAIRVVPTGLAHGTVTAVIDGRPYEITTLRQDVETDGRHATVAWTDDWRSDAARRDFTINAMSLSHDGTLHDFFDGRSDLAAGRVRFVGDPLRRIDEDGLRILRFFRFQARYGDGAPDAQALSAIAARLSCLAPLSAERIWSELERLLAGPSPSPILRLMQRTGVLEAILPGADPAPIEALEQAGAPPDALLRLAALIGRDAEQVARRLKLSNADADRLRLLLAGPVPDPAQDDDQLRRLLAGQPASVLIDRTWLSGAGDAIRARLAGLERPVFPLAGRDAVAAGIPPGPAVGSALEAVRAWWLQGGCRADRAACLARLPRV